MNPAPSVIVFTVLSGLGFGFLAWLCTGLATPMGAGGLLAFALGYALAVGGLLASTFHLGQPKRAWRAFTQWRSSWLSREAWVAVAALLAVAPVALGALGGRDPGLWGLVAAALCLGTVACTSMIYAQLATVPRWHHPLVPVTFQLFALAGGAILLPLPEIAAVLSAMLAGVLAVGFRIGDGRFAGAGSTLATATGLGRIGAPRVFEQPHTGGNYLTREMLDKVATGMPRDQVRFTLGMPLLNPIFRPDRWDYVFRYQHPNGKAELRRVTILFKDEKVDTITADPLPVRDDTSDPALPGYRAPGKTGR